MGCGSTTTEVAVITDDEFQSIGFTLVQTVGLEKKYINDQYTLTYDTVTRKVAVVYGKGRTIYDFILVSIVNNLADLTALLNKNGVTV